VHSTNDVCVVYSEFVGRPVFLMKRSADALTGLRSHTSSVPLVWSSWPHCSRRYIHGPQSIPLGQRGSFAKGLEPPMRSATPHLAPDHWIRSGTTQHWSGNRLSSSAESTSMEHARIGTATSISGQATRWWWWR